MKEFSVVGYPTPGKGKAARLLQAFCAGARGHMVDRIPAELLPGPAAFYGVTPETNHLLTQARAEGRDWYYVDNAYFDPVREMYFRITKNALQHTGRGTSDGTRYRRLSLPPIAPWRRDGAQVLLCPASDMFMRVAAGYPGDWVADTVAELARHTRRELRVRAWQPDKREQYRTLHRDLVGAWAVVTYCSAAAITAMLAGVPAIVTADRDGECISRPLAAWPLSGIESPPMPADRQLWAEVVADQQWTVEEMRDGTAWRMLNA